jgi:hypothetical protein
VDEMGKTCRVKEEGMGCKALSENQKRREKQA